ncbi:MAG: hypothetical protein KDK08_28000 [Rhizobiaceae bacterium]|nr:hypothetical protein [Rhizobiaceae bacterium]
MTHEEQNGLVDRMREHVQDWESTSDMFPPTMQARSIDLIDEAADAIAALQAPQEAGECATDGCGNTATGRFESGGVGSHHCPSCLAKIAALSQPEAQAVPSADTTVEKLVEIVSEQLEIDGDGEGPFIRFDSIEAAVRAVLSADRPTEAQAVPEGWKPINVAPRDGRWVWLWNKHADRGYEAQRFRWSTDYSVFGLGGCWTDGYGSTMGDGVDFDFWRETLPADFVPPASPATGGA